MPDSDRGSLTVGNSELIEDAGTGISHIWAKPWSDGSDLIDEDVNHIAVQDRVG